MMPQARDGIHAEGLVREFNKGRGAMPVRQRPSRSRGIEPPPALFD